VQRRAIFTLVASLVLLYGCGLFHHYFKGGGEPGPQPVITLKVDNQNYYDATVYALSEAGNRERLGQVTGLTRGTFTFRWVHNNLRLGVQLFADGSQVTPLILISPGDSLGLVIGPDFQLRVRN
jgi:hypothetical protein